MCIPALSYCFKNLLNWIRLAVLSVPTIFFVCAGIIASPASAADGHPVLRIGGIVVAPFTTGSATGPIGGALPDFIRKEIAPGSGMEFVWLAPMSFPRAMQSLREGSMDLMLIYSDVTNDTPKDLGVFSWSYISTHPQLAVMRNSSLAEIKHLSDMQGMSIGWLGGSAIPDELVPLAIKWQLVYEPNWQAINLRKLASGRMQAAFFGNEYSAMYFAREEHVDIRLVPLPMPEQPFSFAYSSKTDPKLIAQFDKLAAKAFAADRFKKYLAGNTVAGK